MTAGTLASRVCDGMPVEPSFPKNLSIASSRSAPARHALPVPPSHARGMHDGAN
jgi:hypothetical protein